MDEKVEPSAGGNSVSQESKIEALIDYIATTPQNINYNIVREISKAVILNENHPYFDYYNEKITGEKTKEDPIHLDPGMEDTNPGDEDVGSGVKK